MSGAREELRQLAAETRGALEWMLECGDVDLWNVEDRAELAAFEHFLHAVKTPIRPLMPKVASSPRPAPSRQPAPVSQGGSQPMLALPRISVPPVEVPPRISAGPRPLSETRKTRAPMTAPPVIVDASSVKVAKAAKLQALRDQMGACARCSFCKNRREIVFGSGNPDARLMFVGDMPSEYDNLFGLPYVDRIGQKLGEMIRAIGLNRSDVYLSFLVKCVPDNGQKIYENTQICLQFLLQQIAIVDPQIIVAFGEHAGQILSRRHDSIAILRKSQLQLENRMLRVTYSPKEVLERPQICRKPVWEDLQSVKRFLQNASVEKPSN